MKPLGRLVAAYERLGWGARTARNIRHMDLTWPAPTGVSEAWKAEERIREAKAVRTLDDIAHKALWEWYD